MNYRRNHDGYYDPTAGEALEHIVHEQRRKHRLAQKQEQQPGTPPALCEHRQAQEVLT